MGSDFVMPRVAICVENDREWLDIALGNENEFDRIHIAAIPLQNHGAYGKHHAMRDAQMGVYFRKNEVAYDTLSEELKTIVWTALLSLESL